MNNERMIFFNLKISKLNVSWFLLLKSVLLFWIFVLTIKNSTAQNQIKTPTANEVEVQGWNAEISFGFDFLSNVFVNPKAGSGENRLGFGINSTAMANLKDGRFSWNNSLTLAYGIQKTGSGYLEDYPGIKIPFKKNVDRLLFNTAAAYRMSYFSKFYYTTDFAFNSQLATTFEENYLKAAIPGAKAISQFLAPATLQWSAGIDYRHDTFLSVFLSPVSIKTIVVKNDSIANSPVCDRQQKIIGSVHGNPLYVEGDSLYVKNVRSQFGMSFKLNYENSFFKDQLKIQSTLALFNTYAPSENKRIDVEWRNEISFRLKRMFSIALSNELSYDDDIFLQNRNHSASNCERRPGSLEDDAYIKGVSYAQQLLIKFNYEF